MKSYYDKKMEWQNNTYKAIRQQGTISYNNLVLDTSMRYGYSKGMVNRFLELLTDNDLITIEGDDITFNRKTKKILRVKHGKTAKNKKRAR